MIPRPGSLAPGGKFTQPVVSPFSSVLYVESIINYGSSFTSRVIGNWESSNELTCDDVNVRADGLPPRRQAGVVARVPRARARHQQFGRRPRPALLRLEADAAARRVKVQDLIQTKEQLLIHIHILSRFETQQYQQRGMIKSMIYTLGMQ